MRNSFVLVSRRAVGVSSTLALVCVIACSSPEPSPSPTRQGGTTGSNESNQNQKKTDTDGTSPTTPSSTADCSSHASVDDRPACNTCAKSKCCKEIKACDDNADCAEIQKCLGDCKDDQICALTCLAAHESGSQVLQQFASCVKGKCASECPSSGSEGDGGIDPF